jgi:hypothetical protein
MIPLESFEAVSLSFSTTAKMSFKNKWDTLCDGRLNDLRCKSASEGIFRRRRLCCSWPRIAKLQLFCDHFILNVKRIYTMKNFNKSYHYRHGVHEERVISTVMTGEILFHEHTPEL